MILLTNSREIGKDPQSLSVSGGAKLKAKRDMTQILRKIL